jgi:hypothetical protein
MNHNVACRIADGRDRLPIGLLIEGERVVGDLLTHLLKAKVEVHLEMGVVEIPMSALLFGDIEKFKSIIGDEDSLVILNILESMLSGARAEFGDLVKGNVVRLRLGGGDEVMYCYPGDLLGLMCLVKSSDGSLRYTYLRFNSEREQEVLKRVVDDVVAALFSLPSILLNVARRKREGEVNDE